LKKSNLQKQGKKQANLIKTSLKTSKPQVFKKNANPQKNKAKFAGKPQGWQHCSARMKQNLILQHFMSAKYINYDVTTLAISGITSMSITNMWRYVFILKVVLNFCHRVISLPSNYEHILSHLSMYSTFHDECKQGIDQQFLIGNRFHVKLCILSPYSNRIYYHTITFCHKFKCAWPYRKFSLRELQL